VGPVPDADPLDELASAILDGEATEAERARAAEPEVARRVAAFEAIARRVGQPAEPPSAVARDRAVAAALDAPPELAEPVPIGARRRLPTWLPTLGAAAAAVAIIAGFGLLASQDGGDGDETAGGDAGTAASAFEETGEAAGSAEGGAGQLAASADLGDLGTVEELAEALRPLAAARAATTSGSGAGTATEAADDEVQADAAAPAPGPPPCADRFGPDVVTVATARLDGRPVVVAVLRAAEGDESFVALDADTCEPVAQGPL